MSLNRRDLLRTTAGFALVAASARAGTISRVLPWAPNAGEPPQPAQIGGWLFFSPQEARVAEAIADRIIPPDPETPGGKDAGCATFLDRQLAGPYGRNEGLYVQPPFLKGAKNQGPQDEAAPAARYRAGFSALDKYCRTTYSGKSFAELAANEQDKVLTGLEGGAVKLEGVEAKSFFEMVLKDVQEGFFADPLYGGNRDMAAWRMIGFPGARYDYRDWVGRHNERFPLPPVGITGRPEWTPQKT